MANESQSLQVTPSETRMIDNPLSLQHKIQAKDIWRSMRINTRKPIVREFLGKLGVKRINDTKTLLALSQIGNLTFDVGPINFHLGTLTLGVQSMLDSISVLDKKIHQLEEGEDPEALMEAIRLKSEIHEKIRLQVETGIKIHAMTAMPELKPPAKITCNPLQAIVPVQINNPAEVNVINTPEKKVCTNP